ncbi:hypothetical protein M9458_003324, partial [Cirrhinus mrigala]
VPVPHRPADPLHDQLEGFASACCDFAGGRVVPSCLDLSRMPEPRHPSCPHQYQCHTRGPAVQHVPAGQLGLHDGC